MFPNHKILFLVFGEFVPSAPGMVGSMSSLQPTQTVWICKVCNGEPVKISMNEPSAPRLEIGGSGGIVSDHCCVNSMN